ncbi:Choline/ethanolamine kinase-domain-containing protein [Chytriomyces sp. MP71]|nr:Choline/ethanolamine kinase-domain-containing protein [Chytriomyces sp. MP71]
MELELDKDNSPIVYSHCDLLTGNIIFNANKDRVDFIDYEYGSCNPRGFAIGNHFCEQAGFDCEWHLYPYLRTFRTFGCVSTSKLLRVGRL